MNKQTNKQTNKVQCTNPVTEVTEVTDSEGPLFALLSANRQCVNRCVNRCVILHPARYRMLHATAQDLHGHPPCLSVSRVSIYWFSRFPRFLCSPPTHSTLANPHVDLLGSMAIALVYGHKICDIRVCFKEGGDTDNVLLDR
jgi:hypothetical protein